MKLLKAVIAAGVLTSVYAVDVDVAVGPFGPIQGAENRFMSRLRRDAVGSRKPAAAARVSHPTGLLVWGESLFATEFRRDRVLVASTARAAKREGSKKFAKGWTVFADRGRHCATTRGKVRCARLDGAWGLASHAARGLLFVSSFGSDEVLAFSEGGDFRYALTGDLDCPEGLALNGDQLYVASFLDSRIVAFDLSTRRGRTLSLGPPVGVDYETLAFVPAAFDEPAARAAKRQTEELWNDEESDAAPFVDRLRGPEQLVILGNATLAVSSLHNDSALTLDLATGELIEVVVDGATDDELSGPLGVASAGAAVAAAADTDEDCSDEDGGLLVASYRSDVVSVVRNCGGVAPLQLSDRRLRGPVAIAHDEDDPGSLYVGAYEASAVLYFNVSDAGDEAALLRRVADRVM